MYFPSPFCHVNVSPCACFYHMFINAECTREEANQTEAYPRLPTTPDNALCFIGRRGTRAGPHTVGGFRVRIPDVYISTLLGLHYSEDITQVLHCSLEEKYLDREQRTPIRPRPKGRKCVDSLSHAITIDQSKVFLKGVVYARLRLRRSAMLAWTMVNFGIC